MTPDCNVFDCERRHPKICNYKNQYGRCKFTTYFKYDHDEPNNVIENNAKIAAVEKKMENLQKNTKSQDNGNLEKEIEHKIETLENKLTILDRVITSMEKN